ncbi:hypothetical protein N7462_003332 [Penicillium macrosclerotiorum]|uniref:uncharacterized protein n=1 Tax=Penicillium macrosclerotiorum TaxID=303699 RepID=UPI002546710F|nr:uncharacterized protein N7462_003332 [Penicillium macrosclerotiorum]KAJ5688940.1 hypothetical protein N7462_003332 [Penicillium macrosclerotiorum]
MQVLAPVLYFRTNRYWSARTATPEQQDSYRTLTSLSVVQRQNADTVFLRTLRNWPRPEWIPPPPQREPELFPIFPIFPLHCSPPSTAIVIPPSADFDSFIISTPFQPHHLSTFFHLPPPHSLVSFHRSNRRGLPPPIPSRSALSASPPGAHSFWRGPE